MILGDFEEEARNVVDQNIDLDDFNGLFKDTDKFLDKFKGLIELRTFDKMEQSVLKVYGEESCVEADEDYIWEYILEPMYDYDELFVIAEDLFPDLMKDQSIDDWDDVFDEFLNRFHNGFLDTIRFVVSKNYEVIVQQHEELYEMLKKIQGLSDNLNGYRSDEDEAEAYNYGF